VANTLWKYARAGHLSPALATARLNDALALIDRFEEDQMLAIEALAEAIRNQHPVYDLVYISLARRLGAVLLTVDKRLADLAQRLGVNTAPADPRS
jgi:predicted nucleic acid-binding protein